jgi:hypothetical protein
MSNKSNQIFFKGNLQCVTLFHFLWKKGVFIYVSDNNSPPAHWNGELSVSNDGRGYSPARSTAKKRGRGALGEIGALQEEHFFVYPVAR